MCHSTIDIFDAMSKFAELLDRVEAGEVIGVSRQGKQVAILMPVNQARSSARQAIARLRELRAGSRLKALTIRILRDEGRP